jgi:hypothetical protein
VVPAQAVRISAPHVPDSRDIAGTYEIYVRRLTDDGTVGEVTRVSSSGGTQPGGTAFEVGTPARLFTVRMLPIQQLTRDYDVSLDGQRFLVGAVVGDAPGAPITVVLNATAALKR